LLHLDRLNRQPELRPLELEMCRRDVVHWVNTWGWTYDPREPATAIPFDLFAVQERFMRWLREREAKKQDGLVEKSRDMGATWLCVAYAAHGWLFRRGFAAGFGSRKLELVDKKGDPDCIFEKLRALVEWLPAWMKPADAIDKESTLVNPSNGSSVTGEGGDNIGRGGRKTLYFVDESAFLEHPQMVTASLSQTTRCRIDVSTPNGPGNPFAEKRFRLPEEQVFVLDWHDDPRKDQLWYDEQCRRFDKVTVASEIDRDYSASIEGIVIPAEWVRAAVNLKLPYDPRRGEGVGDKVAGLDVSDRGKNQCVFTARCGALVTKIVAWGGCNTTETAFRAKDRTEEMGCVVLNYDGTGVGAGVRGTLDTAGDLRFLPVAVMTGGACSDHYWPDGRTSAERFLNLRAELWWLLRTRFEKTFDFVAKGTKHPADEMISIPAHPRLIAELSQPLYQRTNTGKIKIESKEDMAKRGIKSPDHADSLVLCFADDVPPDIHPAPREAASMMSHAPASVLGPTSGVLRRAARGTAAPDEDEDTGSINWGSFE
jgi:phage terminase large subunit